MNYIYNLNLYILTILISGLSLAYIIGPSILNIAVFLISILTLFIILKKIYQLNFDFLNKYVLIFFFYYIYIIILSFYSDNPKLSFSNTLPFIKFFFLFIALKTIIEKKIITYNNILLLFSLPFFFILFSSVLEILSNFFIDNYLYENFSGLFFEEKILGSFISRNLPIAVGLFFVLFKNNKNIHIYIFILIILSLVVIIFSLERAAILNLISFIFLLFIFKVYKFNLKFFLSIIIIIISLLFISLNTINLNSGLIKKTFNQVSYDKINFILPIPDHYLLHYLSAIEIFKYNKVFGIGPKMFREKCSLDEFHFKGWDLYHHIETHKASNLTQEQTDENAKIARINTLNSCSTHPHHMHFQILSETGIIGYAYFLLFIFLIINHYFKFLKNQNANTNLNKLLLIGIIMNISPFTTSGNIFSSYFGTMIFMPILFFLVDKKT